MKTNSTAGNAPAFTPGNWFTRSGIGAKDYICSRVGNREIVIAQINRIRRRDGVATGDQILWNEMEANARLIAAAPESYAANRLSLRNVEGMLYRLPLNADTTERKALEAWAETLRAAIAKAEGRA